MMKWSRQSLRIDPMSRSAYGFCQGLRGAVSTSSIPSQAILWRTVSPYTPSRSRMRYRGASRSANASTICWAVQNAVGCSVTPKLQHLAAPMLQHYEHEQNPQADRRHGEEIHRDHLAEVVVQERLPCLPGGRRSLRRR